MIGFLSELGKKSAERWLALVALPGLLFLALAWATWTMRRHGAWLDVAPITARVEHWKTGKPVPLLLSAAAFVIGAAGIALLVQGMAAGVERLWFGAGLGRLGRYLTRKRRDRWQARDDDLWRARTARYRDPSSPNDPDDALEARRRICPVPPARPTWMADRARAAGERVHRFHDLDLTSLWPRLWLVLPDGARAELAGARTALSADARLFAWGLLYLVPALWWWPAVLITLVTCPVAWWRARASTETLTDLVEAAVDLFVPALAAQVGLPASPDSPTTDALNAVFRKDGLW